MFWMVALIKSTNSRQHDEPSGVMPITLVAMLVFQIELNENVKNKTAHISNTENKYEPNGWLHGKQHIQKKWKISGVLSAPHQPILVVRF